MSVKIKVPALGESINEATIATWHKKLGEQVAQDELILELETEKVTLEVNAPASGVLSVVYAAEGDEVAVGQEVGEIKEGAVAAAPAKKIEPAKEVAQEETAAKEPVASPAAAKIMRENNIDSSSVAGSGKDGRITKSDAMNAGSTPAAQAKSDESRQKRVKMSRLRQTIAQRLKESQNTAAILTTFNEIDMRGVMAYRKKYKESFEKKHGIKLGFMSFFVKATVAALEDVPAVNAQIDGGDIVYNNFYDIGIAVGTPTGLVVPVVRSCDEKSPASIEAEISNFGKKARDGGLKMSDLSGGTFSISNGGVYGSLLSTPIINPPQSGILGLHKIQDRPVAVAGEIKLRPMMYVALSYDHRIIDGKDAVTFLVRIKEYIEDPVRLMLGV